MLSDPPLATQKRPSGAWASVCGNAPTAGSNSLAWVAALITVTVLASVFTAQTRLRPASNAMVLDERGAVAVGGVCTVWLAEQVLLTVPLRTVRITG
jgi:hypothetical protein